MTNIVKAENGNGHLTPAWTEADVMEIKAQIAKDATPEEMKLFLYTATQRGLNPLLKQIYCIHRGGKMTIQTSIDGYRLIANRTGKLSGIERGVKYDANGNITHGWARVWRSDWQQPAYEEASLKEYKGQTPTWTNMPETMIKKVAEAAALRMAFPEDLSGLYTNDEMSQADNNGPVTDAEVRQAADALKPMLQDSVPIQGLKRKIDATLKQLGHFIETHQVPSEEVEWAIGMSKADLIAKANEMAPADTLSLLEDALQTVIAHVEGKKIPAGQTALDIAVPAGDPHQREEAVF